MARRVCILTGGGDAPGVNAILRGFVHAAERFGIEVTGCRWGFEGLVDGSPAVMTPLRRADVRGILPKGGSILGCSTRVNPFFVASAGGATVDLGPTIVDRLRRDGVDVLVLIGGDGTTLAAQRFARLGMCSIVVPKTIDNDLGQTDLTCGFESAVETVTHAVDALHATAEAHARVMVVEVMGRNAGFIALHAGVAGGADVVLLPELPYFLERVIAKIKEREALGLRFSIVVVAEGARPAGGTVLEVEGGRPGHLPRLGGAGQRLVDELTAAKLGHEVRLLVLGHLQRGGSPAALDRRFGTQLGTYAAELCRERPAGGRRVVMRDGHVTSLPLDPPDGEQGESAWLHKRLDPATSPLARAARLVGIELGDGER